MADQFTLSQQTKWTVATLPAIVRLGMLVGQRNEPLCPVTLLGEAVTQALRFLPALFAVIWPAVMSLLTDPYCFAICFVRLLVACWPLLRLLTGLV